MSQLLNQFHFRAKAAALLSRDPVANLYSGNGGNRRVWGLQTIRSNAPPIMQQTQFDKLERRSITTLCRSTSKPILANRING